MAIVDTKAIDLKLKNYINSNGYRDKMQEVSNANNTKIKEIVRRVANAYIRILKYSMRISGLSDNAIRSLSKFDYNNFKYNKSTQTLQIKISFLDTYRPSLDEEKYGGVDDIVALLNNGVDHVMNSVYGQWHGKRTRSKNIILRTQFLEQARDMFISTYGNTFNIKKIEINGVEGVK